MTLGNRVSVKWTQNKQRIYQKFIIFSHFKVMFTTFIDYWLFSGTFSVCCENETGVNKTLKVVKGHLCLPELCEKWKKRI